MRLTSFSTLVSSEYCAASIADPISFAGESLTTSRSRDSAVRDYLQKWSAIVAQPEMQHFFDVETRAAAAVRSAISSEKWSES